MPTLGEVPTQRDDGSFRILVCQMGGCSRKEVRELKIAATERLINKYEVNLSAFMVNYNWATVASLANLAFWFCHEEREVRSAAAHNHHETAGMVQAWVSQKRLKPDILRLFTMSLFCSGILIPREPRHFKSRSS